VISLKGKTFLVVDDEPGYREVLSDEFSFVGATTLLAASGNEALEILKNKKVHAIVSDIRMPNGDGVFLLDQIKKADSALVVVALVTGFTDVLPEDIYNKGAEAIFSKPCDMEALIDKIYSALLPEKERWVHDFKRLATDFVIEQEIETLGKVSARVLSIGRGGLFVAMENPPAVNTRVAFSITLTGLQKKFMGTGVCRWVRPGKESGFTQGMGIEFQDLNEESLEIFLAALKQKTPTAYIPKE